MFLRKLADIQGKLAVLYEKLAAGAVEADMTQGLVYLTYVIAVSRVATSPVWQPRAHPPSHGRRPAISPPRCSTTRRWSPLGAGGFLFLRLLLFFFFLSRSRGALFAQQSGGDGPVFDRAQNAHQHCQIRARVKGRVRVALDDTARVAKERMRIY